MNDAKLPDLRQNGLLLNSSSKFMNLLSGEWGPSHNFTPASDKINGLLFMLEVINCTPKFVRFCWSKIYLCVRHGNVWQSGGISPFILNLALVEGELTASCRRYCSIEGKTPGTQMAVLQSWVINRTGSGICSGKISCIITFIIMLLLWIVLSQALFPPGTFFLEPTAVSTAKVSPFRLQYLPYYV